jgi:type I restriction enzyme, S subunit
MTGWASVAIGELCDVVNGGTPKTSVPRYWDGPHRWITPAEMGKRATPYVDQTDRTVTDEGLRNSSARPLPPYSVILSSRAPIGHLAINMVPMATNQGCKGLVPKGRIEHKYLYYFLGSIVDLLNELGTGATFKELSAGKLKEVRVPAPPLPEQRRLVAVLDEAFDRIATAKANAEKNLRNARELFASRTQALFSQEHAWERVQLAELLARGWISSHLDGNHGSEYPRKEEFVDSGVPYIAASAMKGDAVDFGEAKYLSAERAATIRKGLAKNRDVLFAHNATVGPVAILSTNEDVVILGTSLTYYRCNPEYLHPEYLAHFMRSAAFKSQYAQVMRQSTRNQVPITKQREFFHIVPPLEVQKRIAHDLDRLSMETERLIEIGKRRVAALEELQKSLLHQAFTGAM